MKKILMILFFVPFVFISLNAAGSDIEENLSELETSAFNQIYPNDDLSTRLTRLEREFFGAKQSGNIEKRLSKLMNSKNYYCDEPNEEYYSAIINPNKNKGIKGVLSRIVDDFTASGITGYTPQMQTNYGGSYYDIMPYNNIYTPFSSPFYRNKYYSPMDNFRYDNTFNQPQKINPFNPNHKISHHKMPNRRYYPTRYNTGGNIGTRVTILRD